LGRIQGIQDSKGFKIQRDSRFKGIQDLKGFKIQGFKIQGFKGFKIQGVIKQKAEVRTPAFYLVVI